MEDDIDDLDMDAMDLEEKLDEVEYGDVLEDNEISSEQMGIWDEEMTDKEKKDFDWARG